MPLEQLAGEDDIIAKIRELTDLDVFEGEYTPDGYKPELDPESKLFAPYITVKFHPAISGNDPGIADPAWDTQRGSFTVFVVSPDDRTTREIRDRVRVKLLKDFRPEDGSRIRVRGGFSFTDPDVGYHRYVQANEYTYVFNLSP